MILKPFFTYYGGKYRIAIKYPKPVFKTLIEPFSGSAGYAMRYYNLNVVLSDKDPIIAGLWNYLINVKEKEILNLPEIIYNIDEINISQEAKWLIGFWLNKGTSRPCKTPSSWMRKEIRENSFWGKSIKERIAGQLKYIRHWKIFNCDYHEIKNKNATWFVDPPYIQKGKFYKYHEINYENLSLWCKSRKGQIIVCENQGANWMNFETLTCAKSTKGTSKEVMWTNIDSHYVNETDCTKNVER